MDCKHGFHYNVVEQDIVARPRGCRMDPWSLYLSCRTPTTTTPSWWRLPSWTLWQQRIDWALQQPHVLADTLQNVPDSLIAAAHLAATASLDDIANGIGIFDARAGHLRRHELARAEWAACAPADLSGPSFANGRSLSPWSTSCASRMISSRTCARKVSFLWSRAHTGMGELLLEIDHLELSEEELWSMCEAIHQEALSPHF